jgi:hypothetical protein
MTELPPETVNAAASRVSDILKPNGAEHTSEETGPGDRLVNMRTRAKRSDAGKPRETFYVSIPGIRFDLTVGQARESFMALIAQAMQSSDTQPWVMQAIRQLLSEIDRLRASK